MSLEHFKTQVLLLHSERGTLENLSAGFSDRYTVHCATSGSEALTTLGEVPIQVLVSAQELPGMSGLEALREARKRSPDTIGILLAGDDGEDVEALVGEKDMFQVVHGSVTPESLRQLIDNATQQSRLLALAKSANDTSANVDQPTGEHIVMETSENGSAIISDGTGRMPILNPEKIGAQASSGAQSVDVLVLSQDEEFLQTVRESSRGLHNVHNATTISQADEIVRKHTVGVAVIDAAMVGANVEKMTLHLRGSTARLVAIVAGRRDDGEMLMDLINRGKVYRFLLKPVSPGRARLAIEASVKHHLEAPDSAFRVKPDTSGSTAAPAPTRQASEKPAAKAPRKSKAQAAPQPAKPAKQEKMQAPEPVRAKRDEEPRSALPEIKVEPRGGAPTKNRQGDPPIDDGLSDAFGDESSLKETVTGLFKAVGKKAGADEKPVTAEEPAAGADTLDSGGSLLSDPKVLGVAAVAVVALAFGGWWLTRGGEPGTTESPPVASAPAPAESDPDATTVSDPGPAAPAEPQVDVDELLAEARDAAADERIVEPPGGNAIELYLTAAASLPGNPTVESELAATIDRALGIAESALLERRTDAASAALDRVALADPNNPRLPFLASQLQDIRLRDYLADARAAIRNSRFDDASDALLAARRLGPTDTAEIDAISEELARAQNDEAIAGVLELAATRLDDDRLVEPAEDSARYYYRQALATSPNNAAARQGLVVVASKLVLKARAEIDARNFTEAEALLAEARNTDPESAELANADAALAAERGRVEQERIEAERLAAERAAAERAAAERAEQERLAREREAAERAERERLARELEAAQRAEQERLAREREAAERAAAEQRAAERAAAAAALAAGAQQPQTARQASPPPTQQQTQAPASQATTPPPQPVARQQPEPVAATTESRNTGAAPARTPPAQSASSNAAATPVPVSSLNRTKYVAPRYPRSAQRRSLTGWVDIVFTVDVDGSVKNMEVAGSNPGDTFVDSATNAVEDWKFEPVFENGVAVEKRAAVRLMFAIE